MKKKIFLIVISILIFSSILYFCFVFLKKDDSKPYVYLKKDDYSFDSKMIQQVNKYYENNYIISPYSINVALNMLKDGTVGTTREEIDSVISDYSAVPGLDSANSVFINPMYKSLVLKKYGLIERIKNWFSRFRKKENNMPNNDNHAVINERKKKGEYGIWITHRIT